MRFTKGFMTVLVCLLVFGQIPLFSAPLYLSMKASFSEVLAEESPCDEIFAETSYDIDFHLLNQPRAAVIRFKNEDGFFGNSNWVARRGYEDLYIEKLTTHKELPNIKFKIKGEGIYSTELLLIDVKIEAYKNTEPESHILCKAQAQFFATSSKR